MPAKPGIEIGASPESFYRTRGERIGVCGTFPGLLEALHNPEAPPLTPEQIKPVMTLLVEEFNLGKDYPTRAALSSSRAVTRSSWKACRVQLMFCSM